MYLFNFHFINKFFLNESQNLSFQLYCIIGIRQNALYWKQELLLYYEDCF